MTYNIGIIQSGNFLQFPSLAAEDWLQHCFTTRFFEESSPPHCRDRISLARRLESEYFPSAGAVAWGEQVHGARVELVMESVEEYSELRGADAIICAVPDVCLIAWAADCPIVYIIDRAKRAIALVHSGRKGTESGISEACLEKMRLELGTSPEDCRAVISPSIGPCCYPEDLWARIEEQLKASGVRNIVNPRLCTSCRGDLFFSYRKGGGKCGRMLAALMIAKDRE